MAQTAAFPAREHPPGDLAIWVFICAELLAFGVLFAIYGVARMQHLELFDQMQLTLNRDAGAANTALLITSSWCFARAVAAIKRDELCLARRAPALANHCDWLVAGRAGG